MSAVAKVDGINGGGPLLSSSNFEMGSTKYRVECNMIFLYRVPSLPPYMLAIKKMSIGIFPPYCLPHNNGQTTRLVFKPHICCPGWTGPELGENLARQTTLLE
jgi:hypothetical protein